MIMIMIVISNNKNNRLTFGSSRFTRIPEEGLMLVTGFWLPVEEVLIYSHKEKSPAPWGPCGPIGPWEPLNPWGPIAPWDPLYPWGPVYLCVIFHVQHKRLPYLAVLACFQFSACFQFLVKSKMAAKMATIFVTSQASSSATTHKIYLILLRRSMAFH